MLLFLHADTRLPLGWADAVREALADPEVVGRRVPAALRRSRRWRCASSSGARSGARCWRGLPYGDQALFARRAVLEAIGGHRRRCRSPRTSTWSRRSARARAARAAAAARSRPPRAATAKHGVLRTWARHALALGALAARRRSRAARALGAGVERRGGAPGAAVAADAPAARLGAAAGLRAPQSRALRDRRRHHARLRGRLRGRADAGRLGGRRRRAGSGSPRGVAPLRLARRS